MSLIIEDRIKETTTSTGTGTIALAGAVVGFRRFSSVCSINDTFYAAIVAVDPSGVPTGDWEIGLYTYSAANTITRTTVTSSSNNDQPVNFATGTKQVYIDFTAAQIKQISVVGATPSAPMPYGQDASLYTSLCFQEEFNSSTLDTTKWNTHQWYESEPDTVNYNVTNGNLDIYPMKNTSGQFFNRTIDTDAKYYQRYGYFEIEAKLPTGYGLTPAFWLFAHNSDTTRPDIDVMKAYCGAQNAGTPNYSTAANVPTNYDAAVHDDTGAVKTKIAMADTLGQSSTLSSAFHKYAVHWSSTQVKFFFDGKQIGSTIDVSALKTLQERMYILVSMWTGGTAGDPNAAGAAQPTTGETNSFQINYVRAWRLAGVPIQSDETQPMQVQNPAQPTPTPTPAPTPSPSPSPAPAPTPSPSNSLMPYGQDPSLFKTALTFQDEFDGSSLNTTKWATRQWYESANTLNNFNVANSCLNIWVEQPFTKTNRTINTDPAAGVAGFQQTYGFFEVEAKLPIGVGLWPAFWLYGHPGNDRPELDIYEAYSGGSNGGWATSDYHPNNFAASIHKSAAGGYSTEFSKKISDTSIGFVDLSAAFHKYGLGWEADGVTFYFDGKPVGGKWMDTAGYFNRPMYVLLDVWLGDASGTPSTNASLTPTGPGNAMQVNYVRVWQYTKY